MSPVTVSTLDYTREWLWIWINTLSLHMKLTNGSTFFYWYYSGLLTKPGFSVPEELARRKKIRVWDLRITYQPLQSCGPYYQLAGPNLNLSMTMLNQSWFFIRNRFIDILITLVLYYNLYCLSPGPGFWWPKIIAKMINKMT